VLVGYIWTSASDAQSQYEGQYQALLDAGVTTNQIYQDNCLRREERPQLEQCLAILKPGDMLLVCHLERLADSRTHLIETLRSLQQRNVQFKVLSGKGSNLAPDLDLGIIITVIEAITEMEGEIGRQASVVGVEAARARGQAFGPKRKMTADTLRQAIDLIHNSDMNFGDIAKQFGFTRAGLYNYVNGDGSPKPSGRKLLESSSDSDASMDMDEGSSSSTNF